MSTASPGWSATGPTPPMGQPAKKKPGVAGIVIGIVLMVLGPAIGAVVIVMSTVSSVSGVTGAQSYPSSEPVQVSVTGSDQMGIWISPFVNTVCDVQDPAGRPMELEFSLLDQHVNDYYLFAAFTPTTSGVYTITCDDTQTYQVKVAPVLQAEGFVGGIVAGVLVIALVFLGGLVVLIVSIVRRSSWNRTYGPRAGQPPAQPYPYSAGQQQSAYPGQQQYPYPGQPQAPYPGQPQQPYSDSGQQQPYPGQQPPAPETPQPPAPDQPPSPPQA